jgi:putative transposase
LQALRAQAREQEIELSAIEDPDERARLLYMAQRRHFGRFDHALDTSPVGPHWLRNPAAAEIVSASMHHLDGRRYDLDSYCIMSNHVHVLFTPLEQEDGRYHGLSQIMHSLKGYTAGRANEALGCAGQFWQHESYDHIVRDEEEFLRIRGYILNNPVKIGLVEHWTEWPYSYSQGHTGEA